MRRALAGLLLGASLAAGASATSVAFVADISGNATIEGDGKLAFLAELPAGTRLLLGTHASAAIAYAASGAEFTAVGPGLFLVKDDEVVAEKGAKPKRRAVVALGDLGVVAKAGQSATASLRMRSIATPGPGLEYPVSTRVATLKPVMRWRGAPGESYTLTLLDSSRNELWKAEGAKPEGTRPGVALSAGTRYTWTIVTAGKALGEAHFETLPAEALSRTEKARLGARSFSDRVRYALVLQDLGAQQEAREIWATLARERPDLPELPALAR